MGVSSGASVKKVAFVKCKGTCDKSRVKYNYYGIDDCQKASVIPGSGDKAVSYTHLEKYDRLIAEGTFPIPRWGTPEDVAGAVSALCSDQFLYTTGNYIDIDGGFHIKRL